MTSGLAGPRADDCHDIVHELLEASGELCEGAGGGMSRAQRNVRSVVRRLQSQVEELRRQLAYEQVGAPPPRHARPHLGSSSAVGTGGGGWVNLESASGCN